MLRAITVPYSQPIPAVIPAKAGIQALGPRLLDAGSSPA